MTTETFATMVSLFGTGGLKPGAGPTREVREKGFYDILFLGDLPDGGRVEAVVTGDRDPTSKMIAGSALCKLPAQPGPNDAKSIVDIATGQKPDRDPTPEG
ncbi:hypothetical protein [Bradyrhizobium sp. 200]|uniref:hypothetical protein n=1 Tax=Bradyrhizobium sp. 200 TaxID=2782665 RepID=UPI001FFEAC83|nr:hypothetical protein [Bradyrhizobium sp. 200]